MCTNSDVPLIWVSDLKVERELLLLDTREERHIRKETKNQRKK